MPFQGEIEDGLGESRQWSYIYDRPGHAMPQVSSTFTPINQSTDEFFSVESPRRSQRGMDGDTLYDLPEDNPLRASGKRGASSQATTGRRVSLGKTLEYSEYTDEEDIQHQNRNVQEVERPSKRRNPIPAGRSKSARTAVKKSQPGQGSKPTDGTIDDVQASQLSTPPDSGKRSKSTYSRKGSDTRPNDLPADEIFTSSIGSTGRKQSNSSSKRKQKEAKMGPFKNPVISKPVLPPKTKEAPPDPKPSGLTSTYHGFKTSEEKLNPNGITKTTMDRLAAFRYRPQSVVERLIARQRPERPEPGCSQWLRDGHATSDHLHDEGSLIHDDRCSIDIDTPAPESFKNRAVLQDTTPTDYVPVAPESEDKFTENDALISDLPQESNLDYINVHSSYSTVIELSATDNTFPVQRGPGSILPRQTAPIPGMQQPQATQYSELEHLSSSDLKAMANLADMDAPVPKENPQDIETSHNGHVDDHLVYDKHDASMQDEQAHPQYEEVYGEYLNEAGEPLSDSQIEMEAFEEVILPAEVPLDPQWLENGFPQQLPEVQVEHSDLDDGYEAPDKISKHHEDDDFDEGDDQDFLALAADPVPQTQYSSLEGSNSYQSNDLPEVSPETPGLPAKTTFTNDLNSAMEDEFPMDEDDEAEMCKLHDLTTVGMAPQSVQDEFHGEEFSEEYDSRHRFSPPKAMTPQNPPAHYANETIANKPRDYTAPRIAYDLENGEDWTVIHSRTNSHISPAKHLHFQQTGIPKAAATHSQAIDLAIDRGDHIKSSPQTPEGQPSSSLARRVLDDSHEYGPLHLFARPDFPSLVSDRSPIIGLSPGSFLRVCFRIGEMYKEAARCNNQDAVIELFARVTFSSRESGTTKQHFQFADIWHERGPFPTGVLVNFKTSGLVESESRVFIGAKETIMARALGNMKKNNRNNWIFHITNIRPTDWEEIRWTKRIVGAHPDEG